MGLPNYARPLDDGEVHCPKHGVAFHPSTGCIFCKPEKVTAEEYIQAIGKDEPAPNRNSALGRQISGDHYKGLSIQPIEYMHANNIPFMEGCAIKYLTRWRSKGGIKDLEKARHFIDVLIELESKDKLA